MKPQMSGLQATLSLYEREVGPMPEKLSSARKHDPLQVEEMNYTHSFGSFGAVVVSTEDPSLLLLV